jgi:hypothetical protein
MTRMTHYHVTKRYEMDGYTVKNRGDPMPDLPSAQIALREHVASAKPWGIKTRKIGTDAYRVIPTNVYDYTCTIEPCCDSDC